MLNKTFSVIFKQRDYVVKLCCYWKCEFSSFGQLSPSWCWIATERVAIEKSSFWSLVLLEHLFFIHIMYCLNCTKVQLLPSWATQMIIGSPSVNFSIHKISATWHFPLLLLLLRTTWQHCCISRNKKKFKSEVYYEISCEAKS